MPTIKELEMQRDKLFAILKDEQDELNILNEHYHLVSLAKDECLRQIAEIEEGPKAIEPPTLAEVAAEIAAKKREPKEVITEGIIK